MTEPTTSTSTELATRQEAPVAAPTDTDSWKNMATPVFWLAGQIAHTDFVPKGLRGNEPAVAAAILHGREMGLAPMTALTETHVIDGRPSTSAKALRAKVLAAGHEIEFDETTGGRCVVRGRRRGSSKWTEIVWTIDMARAANLTGKTNWKNWPRRMLQARATSELCDLVFADVTLGLAVAEVVEDDGELDGEQQTATPAPEGPKTSVSRTKRRTVPAPHDPQTPAPSGESGPSAPSTPAPKPLEVDVPMPDQPAPSGPVAAEAPGPEVEGTLPADLVEAAAQVPERDEPGDVVQMSEAKITASQLRMLHAVLGDLGVKDDTEKHDTVEALIGHKLEGDTTKSLTKSAAKGVLDQLVRCQEADDSRAALDALIAQRVGEQS